MSDPVSFLLVGAGAIAQSYIQALKASPLARPAAVVEPRSEAARAAAESLGCRAFSSLGAALSETKADAAIVCTPPSSHAEITVALAGRGIHVLCEKPLAPDAASAQRMLNAAARAGVLLTMASKFRYVDDVIEARSIVASGVLGEIILFENTFTARVDMSRRWNSDPAVSGGGVLIDNGTHSVDIIRYVLGPIAAVQVVEGKRVQSLQVEDTARLFVRTKSGVMGSVDLSWTLNKERESYIDIYGSDGSVRVGWKESKYRQGANAGWTAFGRGYDKLAAFRKQIDNFARAIRKEEEVLITSEDALASVQVIEAAYASMAHSEWIAVNGGGRGA